MSMPEPTPLQQTLLVLSSLIGVGALLVSTMFWQSAIAIITNTANHRELGEGGMAMGIMLAGLAPALLLGLVLGLFARPILPPVALNLLASAGPLLWMFTISVPAPSPAMPPYVAPQPAFIVGELAPWPGEPGETWTMSLELQFEPPSVRGEFVSESGRTVVVRRKDLVFKHGAFEGEVDGHQVRVVPNRVDDTSISGVSSPARSNTASVDIRTGRKRRAWSTPTPYARSASDADVEAARLEHRTRFSTELLLPSLYREVVGE